MSPRARTHPLDRVWRHIDKNGPGGCWIWTGFKQDGYGRIRETKGGRTLLVHKLLWEQANGPLPAGKESGHRCPTGARKDCVNPAHIEAITHSENASDYYAGMCGARLHDMTDVYVDRHGRRRCAPCHREANRGSRRTEVAA